jgi:hypothetical protein
MGGRLLLIAEFPNQDLTSLAGLAAIESFLRTSADAELFEQQANSHGDG